MPRLEALAVALAWAGLLHAQSAYSAAAEDVRNGRAAQAVPVLERMLAQSPSDLKARNLLGIALMNLGRNREARVQFQKALAIDANFHAALKNLAVDEMAMGLKTEAKRDFQQLLKAVPDDPVALTYLGEMLFAAGSYAEAKPHYEQLAKLGYPDPYRAGFNLVLIYVNAGDYAAAVKAGESLARDHRVAELYNLLARAYEGAGRTQPAYDALRTAAQIDPRDERNYIDLMSLCLAHENWDLSLEISEIALRNIPDAHRVRMQRGAVLAMKGQMPEAENEFQAAARQAPDSSLPVVALSLVEMDSKKADKAAELLRARRTQNPDDYLVNWMLAEALVQSGDDGEEAMRALEAAVKLNPAIPAVHVLLGKLLVKRGDSGRAAREFEAALKLKPDDNTAAYQLAMICRKKGDLQRAQALMAIAQKATAAPESEVRRRDLVKIIREASK